MQVDASRAFVAAALVCVRIVVVLRVGIGFGQHIDRPAAEATDDNVGDPPDSADAEQHYLAAWDAITARHGERAADMLRETLDHLDAELDALERSLRTGEPRTNLCLDEEVCP